MDADLEDKAVACRSIGERMGGRLAKEVMCREVWLNESDDEVWKQRSNIPQGGATSGLC